jgi:hypothetical protein
MGRLMIQLSQEVKVSYLLVLLYFIFVYFISVRYILFLICLHLIRLSSVYLKLSFSFVFTMLLRVTINHSVLQMNR